MKQKFERIVRFRMPYDKRDDLKGNYGIGSMNIFFILKGKKGAVHVLINTPIFLPKTIEEYKRIGNKCKTMPCDLRDDSDGKARGLDCWDVGFHSKKRPKYMDKNQKRECDILEGGKCYYDGSSLRGEHDKVVEGFIEKGEEFIWEYLEKYYQEQFE